MKKILFLIAMFVITTAAYSQNCLTVSNASFSGPNSNGEYTLMFNYATTANTLHTVIRSGNIILNDDCANISLGSATKTYTGLLTTLGLPGLTATVSAYSSSPASSASCSGTACGSTTIPTASGGPLPVKISSLTAIRSKQIVFINWSTEFEIESKEFIVERAEGNDFRAVGTITSNGNSSLKKSYSFNDKNENTAVTYYRLKNLDLNGRFTYSEIRTVKGIGAVSDVTVFPNPARSNSKISVVGVTPNSSIQLLDFSGKVLKNLNSNSTNSLDLTGVRNGTYLVRIIDKATNEIVNKTLTVNN